MSTKIQGICLYWFVYACMHLTGMLMCLHKSRNAANKRDGKKYLLPPWCVQECGTVLYVCGVQTPADVCIPRQLSVIQVFALGPTLPVLSIRIKTLRVAGTY